MPISPDASPRGIPVNPKTKRMKKMGTMTKDEFKEKRSSLRYIMRGLASAVELRFDDPISRKSAIHSLVDLVWASVPWKVIHGSLYHQMPTGILRLPPTSRIDMLLNLRASREACEAHRMKCRELSQAHCEE